jgi:xylulokinase
VEASERILIIGLDIGTQSLKAVVANERLEVLGDGYQSYEPSFPYPGAAEQDAEVWEHALAPAIKQALDAARVRSIDIRALGICGQLDGCIAIDASGRSMAPCMIWMDRRAEQEISDVPAVLVRERSGVVLDASHMAAKIRWQKRHLLGASRAVRFHQPVSYMVSRLTGEHVFDHGLASTTMLYDLTRRGLDPELLDRFGVRAEELPRIAHAADPAGVLSAAGAELTGLPAGTTVAVGTGDDFSNPLGAGVVTGGRGVCTLGTAEVVGAVHDSPVIDPRSLVETHCYAGRRFFIENPGWLCGGAVEWLIRTCRLADAAELDALAGSVAPGAENLLFLPALSGAMAPQWVATARGCFYGLTPAHGNGHLARALLEGCAFAMRDVLDRLRELGIAFDSVILLGGGARSLTWARIRADLMGLRIERPVNIDTSPVGAAMLAAVAAGLQPDLETAAGCVARDFDTIEPDPRFFDAYQEAYLGYRALFEALRPMFNGAHP